MNIKLLSLEYDNIREFENLEISFTNESQDVSPVNLVQMPTGTGKTTTIKLLRYTFSGKANDEKYFPPDKIKSFSPQFSTNKTKGEFKVKLKIDGEIVYISLELDYKNGTARYYTSKASEEGGGRERGFNLDTDIKSLLTPNFVELFVFDGEKAQEILDIDENIAEDAIKFLYYLDKFSNLESQIDKKIEEKRSSTTVTNTETQKGLSQTKTRLEKRRKTLKKLKEQKEDLETDIEENEEKIEEIRNEIDDYDELDEQTKNDLKETKEEIKEINQKINQNTIKILNNFRNPINIHPIIRTRLQKLKSKMVSLKLPRATAKEFFQELIDEDISGGTCICGRELEEEHKEHIKEKMDDFLSQQQISIINAVKSSIRDIPEDKPVLEDLITEGKSLKIELNKKKDKLNRLRARRNSEIDENYRKKKQEEMEKLEEEIEEKEEVLELLTESDQRELEDLRLSWEENIPLCKEEVEKWDKKLSEATNTVEFTQKARNLKEIINEIKNRSLEKLKGEIKDKTNLKTKKILDRNDIIVDEISNSLKIEERSGVSEGQTLSIAYAFLSSLFEKSPHNLPFIVDTPAGPLDKKVRREVAKLLPKLFDQLVIFITSAEKPSFGEKFYDKENVKFITVWKEDDKIKFNNSPEFFKQFHEEE